jgi:hypothetical protein
LTFCSIWNRIVSRDKAKGEATMYTEKKSKVQMLHEKYGWPLKINARGYVAYLIDVQPLVDGLVTPIYRFPGGDSLVDDCEMQEVK